MKKRAILIITIAALSLPVSASAFDIIKAGSSGDNVLRVQQRLIDMQYLGYKPTSSYGSMSSAAAQLFQQVNDIAADGTIGEQTASLLFSYTAKRNTIPQNVKIPIGPSLPQGQAPYATGVLSEWSIINPLMQLNQGYMITDVNTGKKLEVTRVGGKNHALIEPSVSADKDAFLEIFGGEFNWSKRSVVVSIDGTNYAASLQGMPRGEDLIAGNGIGGGVELYFNKSTSDFAFGLEDAEHNSFILKAAP